MEETGAVIAIEGGIARVRLMRRATCEKCGMCGIGQRREIVIEVANAAGARVGDEVRLAMESGNLLRAAVVAYCLPLLALVIGYAAFSSLLTHMGVVGAREGMAIAGGFICFALSYLWIRSYDRRAGDRFAPRMIEVSRRAEQLEPPVSPD